MQMMDISLSVNGRRINTRAEPRTQLVEILRDDLNLTGSHIGCEQGVCGACTVIVDGKPQRSCISYAGDANGTSVTTIEGFDNDPLMNELRGAFSKYHALQCGFCTPGMLITARDIVLRLGEIEPARIREELSGNICRCTGYVGIVEAIHAVCKGKQPAMLQASVAAAPLSPATARPAPAAADIAPRRSSDTGAASIQSSRQGWTSIEQRVRIASSAATVWARLADLKQVATCLPGAEITRIDGNRVEGRMVMALGPMKVSFVGDGTYTLDAANRKGQMAGGGRDTGSGSSANGEVEWRVMPDDAAPDAASIVLVTLSWRLSGRLAQFNRAGLVQDVVQRLTADFVGNLEQSIRGEPVSQTGARPINMWSLIWSILKARLFGRSGQ